MSNQAKAGILIGVGIVALTVILRVAGMIDNTMMLVVLFGVFAAYMVGVAMSYMRNRNR